MVTMDSCMSTRLMVHKKESHVVFAICNELLLHQCDMAEWYYIVETLNRVPKILRFLCIQVFRVSCSREIQWIVPHYSAHCVLYSTRHLVLFCAAHHRLWWRKYVPVGKQQTSVDEMIGSAKTAGNFPQIWIYPTWSTKIITNLICMSKKN